jgi:predicted dehydrogenase
MPDRSATRVTYGHEYERRLRVALVGCGGQAFRNLLPSLHYAPVELVATCDISGDRAAAYARCHAAERSYTDYGRLLEREAGAIDAVLLATGYDACGRPLYPAQATRAMEAGLHVFMEKPPAATVGEIEALREVRERTGRQVAVGLMKMFTPAARKVREIIRAPDFGRLTTFYLRDPEMLPPREHRQDLRRMKYVLDHVVHSASLIHYLMGPLSRLYLEEGPSGESMVTLKFTSGACGVLHMAWGQSGLSPRERYEVIGEGANVVVENNRRITYYRRGHPGSGPYEYGRVGDFTSPDDCAPLTWEIDGYSGQPFNMHIFYQGYAQEILNFACSVLNQQPVRTGGLEDAWHVVRFFEALQSAGPSPVELPAAPTWTMPDGER